MTDHVRVTALSLAWTLVACHRTDGAPVEPTSGPGPIAEVESDRGALPITPVPQLTPIELSEWVFEPGGNRFATSEFNDCSIFDVASGRLVWSVTLDQQTPCDEWGAGQWLIDSSRDVSSDDRLELDITTGEILDMETGNVLRKLACRDCATSEAVTWSRTGHQVAVAWLEPPRVEVFDADTGKRLHAEQIPIDGELDQLELGWTAGGATVLWTELGAPIDCDGYDYDCEYNDDEQVFQMREASRQALVLGARADVIPLGDRAAIDDVLFDPDGRWAYWRHDEGGGRDAATFELNFVALAGQASGPSWQVDEGELYGGGEPYEGEMTREGSWRSDGFTHWAVLVMHDDYDENPTHVGWETLVASPPLGLHEGTVAENLGWGAMVELELLGFAGDSLRVSGESCVEESCTPLGVVPAPNCELFDIGSGHGTELHDCEGQLFMRNSGGMKRLPHDPNSLEWWWSRGGALVLHDGPNFTVLDAASGVGGVQRSDKPMVLEGRIGLEIERLVLMTDVGIEVLDLSSGKVFAKVPDLFPDDVAFSPTGDRLAVLAKGELRVLSLPSGEQIASWPTDFTEIAFRQDGKAILAGSGVLGWAYDAHTGAEINSEALTTIFDAANRGELDPSWRWIMDDEARQLTRTLDGLTLEFSDRGAWLPETGQYEGSPPGMEIAFRVGTDAHAVPEFDADDLGKWLRSDDLVELFLAGQPIPKPTITMAELAGVRAGTGGQGTGGKK